VWSWDAAVTAGGSVINVPFSRTPDLSWVEFSESESFTVKFLTTDVFDEDAVATLSLVASVNRSATDDVTDTVTDTSPTYVTLLLTPPSMVVASTSDVETSSSAAAALELTVAVAVSTAVLVVDVRRGLVRLTGDELVP